jgi:Berberine and berberine like
LMTAIVHRKAPPLPFVPQALHGKPVVAVVCCYCGSIEKGEKVVRPLKDFGSPVLDLCGPRPFAELQGLFDPSFPHGWWYYFRACDIADLTDEIVGITIDYSSRFRSPLTGSVIWQRGGEVARVGEEETAFSGRDAGYTFNIGAATETAQGFDEEREWVRNFWSALRPYQTSVYVNFLMEEGKERIQQAYGSKKYERLTTLKRKYDPDNFFRLNQNIPPA